MIRISPHRGIHRGNALKKQQGLTIIQLMMVLFIAGIVGYFVIQKVVDYRCSQDPSASMCQRAAKS
jgi:Tfp pilus assembly protein PilE